MAGFIHRSRDYEIVVESVAYHRNGICGTGFHAVLFRQLDNTPMLGIVFEEPGHIAILDRGLAAKGNIGFASNSWRGDEFEQALRYAVAEYRIATETLPVKAWAYAWNPQTDPIAEEAALPDGNAEKANALLAVIPKIVKR